MVKHQVYHKLNLLSQADFSALVAHKENIIYKSDGAKFINEDGTVTVDKTLKDNVIDEPEFYDYKISKEVIFNFRYDIENFINFLGQPFYPAILGIQNALSEVGVINPRPYMSRVYRHNNPNIPWHRHFPLKKLKHNKFWITILYLHPNWDTKYGGQLRIGLNENEDLLIADCIGNSVVMHNGYYGHGVMKVIQGFEGDRDILLMHWICD